MKQHVLLCGLLALPLASQAQVPSPTADTTAWRDTGPKTPHGLTLVRTTDGKTVRSYFPVDCVGFEEKISYFSRNPEVRPFPRLQYVEVQKIASATIRGYQLENMGAAGFPEVLALRLVEGPVEVFALSGTAGDNVPLLPAVLVPALALPTLAARLGGLAIDRNQWFLRRNGQLVALTRSSFRRFMSEYTADCLALSTQIKEGAEGFRHQNTPEIIRRYNEFLLHQQATK